MPPRLVPLGLVALWALSSQRSQAQEPIAAERDRTTEDTENVERPESDPSAQAPGGEVATDEPSVAEEAPADGGAHSSEAALSSEAAPSSEAISESEVRPPSSAEGSVDVHSRLEQLEALVVQQQAQLDALIAAKNDAAKNEAQWARERAEAKATVPADTKAVERPDPLTSLMDQEFPGSTPLFGSKFRFGFGGYVKLDAIYDLSGIGNRYAFSLSTIPPRDAAKDSSYITIDARESRLHFEVRYGGDEAPANQALVEIDFYSSSTSPTLAPRLRHAYMRWGNFLAGQTWSLLSDLRPLPYIIDFAFADSLNALRVPQVRYQGALSDWLHVRVGLEMPTVGGVDNPHEVPGKANPRLPELAGGFSLEGKQASVSAGGSLAEIRWDGRGEAPSVSALSWGAVVNGRIYFDREHSGFFGFHGYMSRGGGQESGLLTGQNSNAVLTSTLQLETLAAYQVMAGAQYQFVPALSVNLAVAANFLEPSSEQSPSTLEAAWTLHTNIVGHISEPLQLGVEWMWGYAQFADGQWGMAERIQAMTMYSF